jgi:hypothetical protein
LGGFDDQLRIGSGMLAARCCEPIEE